MRSYLTEAIGTFFLVLTVGLTVSQRVAMAPLAIGASLMIMVYMGGHISGGHYNPAVTLAVYLRGKLHARELVPYWGAQIVGAFIAAAVVYASLGKTFAGPAPAAGVTSGVAMLIELVYTFALCIVVLHTATTSDTQGNSYYGLAIGFTIVVAAFAGGPISGGAFNPSVSLGPALFAAATGQTGALSPVWLYIVGPLLGGAIAAGVFRLQVPQAIETKEPPIPEP
jgi:aquaporin Z